MEIRKFLSTNLLRESSRKWKSQMQKSKSLIISKKKKKEKKGYSMFRRQKKETRQSMLEWGPRKSPQSGMARAIIPNRLLKRTENWNSKRLQEWKEISTCLTKAKSPNQNEAWRRMLRKTQGEAKLKAEEERVKLRIMRRLK